MGNLRAASAARLASITGGTDRLASITGGTVAAAATTPVRATGAATRGSFVSPTSSSFLTASAVGGALSSAAGGPSGHSYLSASLSNSTAAASAVPTSPFAVHPPADNLAPPTAATERASGALPTTQRGGVSGEMASTASGGDGSGALSDVYLEEEEDEMCGICMDAGDFLTVRTCGHTMCVDCASELLRLHPADVVPCPFCRCVDIVWPRVVFHVNVQRRWLTELYSRPSWCTVADLVV